MGQPGSSHLASGSVTVLSNPVRGTSSHAPTAAAKRPRETPFPLFLPPHRHQRCLRRNLRWRASPPVTVPRSLLPGPAALRSLTQKFSQLPYSTPACRAEPGPYHVTFLKRDSASSCSSANFPKGRKSSRLCVLLPASHRDLLGISSSPLIRGPHGKSQGQRILLTLPGSC